MGIFVLITMNQTKKKTLISALSKVSMQAGNKHSIVQLNPSPVKFQFAENANCCCCYRLNIWALIPELCEDFLTH